MKINIALAGNPNSGKTTLFNHLTGSNQHVGNWPGVTVEKKEGTLRGQSNVVIQDLPGIYSLSPYTIDELIARDYLVVDRPDAIINIVDGTNIERNLYLTTQLIELGIPVVVALNMIDVVRRRGDRVDVEKLSALLKCDVVEVSALRGEGTHRSAAVALDLARKKSEKETPHVFTGSVEHALAHIEEAIESLVDKRMLRWYAIKVFERDEKVLKQLALSESLRDHIEEHIVDCEKEMDDDAESIITDQRYRYVSDIVACSVVKKREKNRLSSSDRIDNIVTNRILALPIFVLVMGLVYFISISTVGDWVTGWTEELFASPLFTDDLSRWLTDFGLATWLVRLIVEGVVAGVGAVLSFVPQMAVLFLMLALLEDVGYMARAAFIMDRLFRRFGLSGKSVIPMLISSGCAVPGIMATRTIEQERDRRMTIMTTPFMPCSAKMPIVALIAGVFFDNAAWVATAVYFIGIAAVFFSGLILKKIRAFAGKPAPFLMELPDYHIPSWINVARTTLERIWLFIKKAGTVIVAASIFIWFTGNYGWSTKEAKSVCSFGEVEEMDESLLGVLGSAVAPIFQPLGFGTWQMTVATVMGMVAKEEVVGALGVLYHTPLQDEEGELQLDEGAVEGLEDEGGGNEVKRVSPRQAISEAFDQSSDGNPALAAFSFLIFNLLCAPCFAAIGAIRREMNSARWTFAAVAYMTAFSWAIALMTYQIGMWVSCGHFGVWTLVALLVALLFLFLLFRKGYEPKAGERRAQGGYA